MWSPGCGWSIPIIADSGGQWDSDNVFDGESESQADRLCVICPPWAGHPSGRRGLHLVTPEGKLDETQVVVGLGSYFFLGSGGRWIGPGLGCYVD